MYCYNYHAVGVIVNFKHGKCIPSYSNLFEALTAITIAMQADRGQLRYSDRIEKYWPEFGQNGKETITILNALQHQVQRLMQYSQSIDNHRQDYSI